MATFIQRGKVVRAQVRMQGQKYNATFDTRTEAQAWADGIEKRIRDGEIINEDEYGENPSVLALMQRYIKEVSPNKRCPANDERIYKRLKEIDVFKKRLSNFGPADLRAWRDARLNGDPLRKIAPVTSGSALRELCLLSAVFTHGIKEWGLPLKENPCALITWPKKNKSRRRRVRDEEIATLMTQLGWDCASAPKNCHQWLAWAIQFALVTAMRRTEITSMKWRYVDKDERKVHLPTTKNGNVRDVPLRRAALDLLALLPEGKLDGRVCEIAANSITSEFWRACKAAEIENLHFHDLRHEATTRIAKMLRPRGAATDVDVIKLSAITGHESLQMLRIYFNPTATEMATEFDRLEALDG